MSADEIGVNAASGSDSCQWDEFHRDFVSLTWKKINVTKLTELVADPGAGAISTFIGITRNNFENKAVAHLSYEAYDEMALLEMMSLCTKVRTRWPGVSKVAIEHKLGDCPVGEISVYIVVSSPHRRDSLEAVHFAIDELKATVPIWKKEHYVGEGEGEGVGERSQWKKNAESPQPILSVFSAKSEA